jgi:serine/threonine-protein kinase
VLGERVIADDDWAWLLELMGDRAGALRSRLFLGQIATELALASDRPDRALDALDAATQLGLFDLLWIDNCPLLASLAGEPRLATARRKVADRAASVLAAYRTVDAV